ncbi:MAG: CHAT domain-containing protein [Pirellulaceae bacterium]
MSEMPDVPSEAIKPAYLVVFEANVLQSSYSPIIDPTDPGFLDSGTLPHQLDRDLIPGLQAMWYCLHLPATCFDMMDIHARHLKAFQDLDGSHAIILCTCDTLPQLLPHLRQRLLEPVIAFVADSLADSVRSTIQPLDFNVSIVRFFEVDPTHLQSHWNLIAERLRPQSPTRLTPPAFCERLDIAPILLPLRRLRRQFPVSGDVPAPSDRNQVDGLFGYSLHAQTVLSTIARLEREGRELKEADELFPNTYAEEARKLRMPVAIGLPGLPGAFFKTLMPTQKVSDLTTAWDSFSPGDTFDALKSPDDRLAELSTLRFLVTHRACARNGIGLCLSPVPRGLFQKLTDLEDHFKGKRRKPKAIWRWLNGIGHSMASRLTDMETEVLVRASVLDAFTNFPIGWTILPGDTSPLCCRIPIAYRPLLPLTSTVQTEIPTPPITYFRESLSVLLVECLAPEDPIAGDSRRGLNHIVSILRDAPNSRCELVNATTPEDVREAIARVQPDVLLISTHGRYIRERNLAGIVVGEHLCLGPELGRMPPLVILSACHVAPRGRGVVNIAELLIREGAHAVLANQIPVHVFHNALLIARFFVYITEAIRETSGRHTIADIWHHTATSNAINDVVSANRGIERWARGQVVYEFMARRSVGRLRLGHIYRDTEEILREMAVEDGIEDKFDQWLNNHGYVPESLFYFMIGWPERIAVLEPMVEKFRADRRNST